ncbi:MAG: peptidoglycan DD-metalloendopeptidase family protein [Candidatus Puniceispirillaceae bacterium]
MTDLLLKLLRRATPPMLRSDSPDRPMVVRRKHWFLQETRFLFLTRKGPVEITVKPALILGGAFVGLVGTGVTLAATLFVGFKSVEVVTNESITPAEASAPHLILSDDARPISETSEMPVVELAMAVTPPPSWPPSLAATDAGPAFHIVPPPASAKPDVPRWPPSLAATGTVAPFTILLPKVARAPVEPVIVDIPDLAAAPAVEERKSDHEIETIAMMVPPRAAALPPVIEPNAIEPDMVPDDQGGDLPVFTRESRERKLLRSMAREVRGIRTSLVNIGLPETIMPDASALQADVQTANFAGLAMAVEDHRSLLRKVPMKPPMLYFYITSNYGWRKHPVLKKRMFHHGIDLAGTWQETVHTPAAGTVIFAGREGAFGKVVKVRHANDIITIYAHLAKITVKKGADVVPGTVVGKMGRTGRVDGAHLHYEIRYKGKSFDPQLFFDIGHRIGVGGELMLATDQP